MDDFPALIISKELAPLYQKFSAQGLVVSIVNNVADLREFLARYNNIEIDTPIILSDLARLGIYQSRVLKFVEETKTPLICLSSQDCITRVLLSRFKRIVKVPNIVKNERDRPDFLIDRLTEGEGILIEDVVRNAPSAYQVIQVMKESDLPSKAKMQQVVFHA